MPLVLRSDLNLQNVPAIVKGLKLEWSRQLKGVKERHPQRQGISLMAFVKNLLERGS